MIYGINIVYGSIPIFVEGKQWGGAFFGAMVATGSMITAYYPWFEEYLCFKKSRTNCKFFYIALDCHHLLNIGVVYGALTHNYRAKAASWRSQIKYKSLYGTWDVAALKLCWQKCSNNYWCVESVCAMGEVRKGHICSNLVQIHEVKQRRDQTQYLVLKRT